jgi:hypothetical protein
MQEQAVASLARKFQDIFGHEGWGADYKPSARPGTSDPIERGPASSGVATTQDVNAVPARIEPGEEGGQSVFLNQRGEAPPLKAVARPGKPGMEIGEDVDADDLADLHQQRVGGDGEPISTEEVDPNFARGRDLGDRTGVNSKPAKELPGHKKDAYNTVVRDAEGNRKVKPDGDRPFAAYNRENRVVSESDLQQRRMFQRAGGETERSSVLRQQLRALLESDEPEAPGTRSAAARATQIADLQRRLRLAERLDSMSGINSMLSDTMSDGMDPVRRSRPGQIDPELKHVADEVRRYQSEYPDIYGPEKQRIDALAKELDDIRTGNGPVDQARLDRIAEEMTRVRQHYDNPDSPGIASGSTGMIPSRTADLQSGKLAASATPIDADEILPPRQRDLDLNNEPIDVEFEVKKPPEPAWKKWAKRAGVVGGGILGYEFLRQGGQPPINGGPPIGGGGQMDPPFPPGSGPDGPGGYVPYGPPGGPMGQDLGAKPEDRIRALQNFQMQLNPNTQILQSYTR